MPLVELAQLEKLIPDALFVEFTEDGDAFVDVEKAAAKLIRDGAGILIPESAEDAPDWVITPAAWLITFLAREMLTSVSPEYELRVDKNYKRALEIIQAHEVATVKTSTARIGRMEEMFI